MLYIVPTPVGNLEDITLRAIRVLKEADIIACEDTRTSGVLLNHYGITTQRTSFHDHNEQGKGPWLVEQMAVGSVVALISDAGTPGISDPGFSLVRRCVEAGINVTVLPGATAFVPALVASGIPCDRFVFEGFLPLKKGRQTKWVQLSAETRTIVLYESPHRLIKTLRQIGEHLGEDRHLAVVREISKTFEEVRRGTPAELITYFGSLPKIRGEFVLILSGFDEKKRREL